jgi:hypothetical protein
MSPLLGFPAKGKVGANARTDTTTTPVAFRGTDGSNPASSTGESSANFNACSLAAVEIVGPGGSRIMPVVAMSKSVAPAAVMVLSR